MQRVVEKSKIQGPRGTRKQGRFGELGEHRACRAPAQRSVSEVRHVPVRDMVDGPSPGCRAQVKHVEGDDSGCHPDRTFPTLIVVG